MSLDRRQFVTGLTAVAATGIAPALAAPPIPLLVRSGHSYRWRSYQPRELIAATFTTAMCSPWHVDMRGEDDVTYLHVPSGFYFAVYPDATNDIWQVCAAATLPLPFYDSHRKLIGRAVVFAHRIADDGRGFDPAQTPDGAGLRNIRERVQTLDGTLRLASTFGHGTVLTISLPWPARPSPCGYVRGCP